MLGFEFSNQKLRAENKTLEFANKQLKIALGKYKAEVDRLKKQLKNTDKEVMIFFIDDYKDNHEIRSCSKKFADLAAKGYKVINVDQMPVGNSGISYVITYVDSSK